MWGMLAEGILARKAPNYPVMDVASRFCNSNSCSLLAGELAGTFDILLMPFMKEWCSNVSPSMSSGRRSYQGFDVYVCTLGWDSFLPSLLFSG